VPQRPCACVLTLLLRGPSTAEQVNRRFRTAARLRCDYSTTLFRGCSTLLYRCPDGGVYVICSCAGALTIPNRCTESAAQFICPCLKPALMLLLWFPVVDEQLQRFFCSSEQKVLYRCPEKDLYLRQSCSACAHTLQCRWPVASVQVPAVGVVRASAVKIAYVKPHGSV
jgi:hypothetical protein